MCKMQGVEKGEGAYPRYVTGAGFRNNAQQRVLFLSSVKNKSGSKLTRLLRGIILSNQFYLLSSSTYCLLVAPV